MWIDGILSIIIAGEYPEMSVRKMSRIRLEHLVTQLIQFSVRNGQIQRIGSRFHRPLWWPKHQKFKNPITPPKGTKSLRKWNSILRDLVACCSRFYRLNFSCISVLKEYGRSVFTQKLNDGNVLKANLVNIISKNSCKENKNVLKKRHSHRNNSKKCDIHLVNFTPVVNLYNISNKSVVPAVKKKGNTPLNVLPLLNFPPKSEHNQKLASSSEKEQLKNPNNCYVRLHDILEIPKPIVYDKTGYMKCLSLEKTNDITISTYKTKPTVNKSCRNYNIPITSDLGQMLIPTSTIDGNSLWRMQRLEWFLKEIPQNKSYQEYPVNCTKSQSDMTHHYSFPKRQFNQTQISLRNYSLLKKCKPCFVSLEVLHEDILKKLS